MIFHHGAAFLEITDTFDLNELAGLQIQYHLRRIDPYTA